MATKSFLARFPAWPVWRRWLLWTAGGIGALGLLAFIVLIIAVFSTRASLPSYDELKSSPNGQMIRVHANDGTVLVSLGPSYGEWVEYDKIPQVMRDAIVAIEDKRFEDHWGVDAWGMLRAVRVAMAHSGEDKRMQGASTITQQVARTIFLNNKYDISRKVREGVLALAMERKFSKHQILELYLNKVYFGGGAYGIDAASRKFFGHPATQLSLSEAAVIAGLVKAPSVYSPTADAQAAVDRAGVVLQVMQDQDKITAAQARAANPKTVKMAPESGQNSARYFTDWALPQLEVLIDETEAPLEVWTTLDPNMQRAANEAIRTMAPKNAQGALISLDRDGAVRAMIGGKDYVESIYNRSTQATRQPGSSWKLFVYLAALEAGHRPEDMVVDEQVTIRGWSPRNSSGKFRGEMTLRNAFAYSVNTIAAKLGQEVGYGTVADMARRFGISTKIETTPAMVLGTSDVRLIDMTRAFASVGNRGVAVTPYGITRVTANGAVIYQHEVDTSRVLVGEHVAAQMTDLLQTAVNTGTGKAAQIGRPVAGKTGTTSSNKDGWFIGFSSGLTTGVWMGRDDAKVVPGLQGGTAPARAFQSFMSKAVAGRPVEQFATQVTLPEWEADNEQSYIGTPDEGLFVDEDGNPVAPDQGGVSDGGHDQGQGQGQGDELNDDWLDKMTGKAPRDRDRDAPREDPRDQPAPIPAPRDIPRNPSANPNGGPREPTRVREPQREPQRDPRREDDGF
jgi:penicillin-binding protein 1A